MKLEGKKFCFLGDSITEGCGVSARDKVFHQLIAQQHGLKIAYNFGVGGTRIARQKSVTPYTHQDLFFELRAETMPRDTDAIVVFGGTNDFGHGDAHFGELDSEDIYTFCGAVNSLISFLEKNFPNAKKVFMTPIHRVTENNPSTPDGKLLADYVWAINEICKKRGVEVIDLFAINPLDPTDKSLVPDGLHPNDAGHEIMARVIAEKLLEI